MSRRDSSVRRLLRIVLALSVRKRTQFIFLVFLSLFSAIIESIVIALVIPFTEGLTNQGGNVCSTNRISDNLVGIIDIVLPDACSLSSITLCLVVGSILSGLLKIYYTYLSGRYVAGAGREISRRSYISIFRRSYETLISRAIEEDVNGLVIHMNNCLLALTYLARLISSLLLGLIIVLFLSVISPAVTVISLIFFVSIYLGVSLSNRVRIAECSRHIEVLNEQQIETIQSIHRSPRLFLLESNIEKGAASYACLEHKKRSESLYIDLLGSIPRSVLESLSLTFFVVVTFWASNLNGGNALQFIPYAAGFLLASQRLIPSMQQSYMNWLGIRSYIQSVNYIYHCINDRQVQVNTLISTSEVFEIGTKGLHFAYPGKHKKIFSSLNISFKKGVITCIVGASGYGKSTLIDIIIGLRLANTGYVYLKRDCPGQNLKRLSPFELVDVSLCEQGAVLKKGTLLENLIGSSETSDSCIYKAKEIAKRLGLEKYLQADISDVSGSLSGGEIQRLCVGRALLKPSSVVILDEPTSALDQDSCKRLIDVIRHYGSKRIVILTSHDKRLIDSCDKIIDLELLGKRK